VSENSIWLRAACFPPGLRPAVSTYYSNTPASPSLPDEKPLDLGPTTRFSEKAYNRFVPPTIAHSVDGVQQQFQHALDIAFWIDIA
jgi:hypothetical protein